MPLRVSAEASFLFHDFIEQRFVAVYYIVNDIVSVRSFLERLMFFK